MSESKKFDPFTDVDDAPLIQPFIDAAFRAYEGTGSWRIADQEHRELMASFGLTPGEAAAYAYLGQRRAADIHEVLEDEALVSRVAGESHE